VHEEKETAVPYNAFDTEIFLCVPLILMSSVVAETASTHHLLTTSAALEPSAQVLKKLSQL
jgi:hypothetical protein